tara:strand:+ start:368 stop:529 length:162 start_codon:yes stop_codon:yes gene_type:complete
VVLQNHHSAFLPSWVAALGVQVVEVEVEVAYLQVVKPLFLERLPSTVAGLQVR